MSSLRRSAANPDRQHRLRGDLATHRHNDRDLEQWEYEVTSGGRGRYLIDHQPWPTQAPDDMCTCCPRTVRPGS